MTHSETEADIKWAIGNAKRLERENTRLRLQIADLQSRSAGEGARWLDKATFEKIIDEWTGEAFNRGHASSWHFGELYTALHNATLSASRRGEPAPNPTSREKAGNA